MSGMNNVSAFETFDRMSQKIDQIEAEAEASTEIAEQYTGDSLAEKFGKLEQTAGADDDLMALKRKMGVAPPEAPRPVAQPSRIEAQPEAPQQHAVTQAERGGYKHFMLKEIHEQPDVIEATLRGRIDLAGGDVYADEIGVGLRAAKEDS